MVEFSKKEIDKTYSTADIIALFFKMIFSNMGKIFKYTLKIIAIVSISTIPIFMLVWNLYEDWYINQVISEKKFFKIVPNINGMDITNILGLIFLIFICIFICFPVCKWLTYKTIVDFNTGVPKIESQKGKVSGIISFLSIQATEYIFVFSVLPVLILNSTMAGIGILYIWVYIQILIFLFLLRCGEKFANFEIIAKGKNLSDAMVNSSVNLFFSKNHIMLKTYLGRFVLNILAVMFYLIYTIATIVISELIINFDTSLEAYIFWAIEIIIIIISTYLFYFLNNLYSYLVYMVNEVRDDKR